MYREIKMTDESNESKNILTELNRSDNPAELGLHLVAHRRMVNGKFEIWTGDAGKFRRIVNLDCIAEYQWEIISDADGSLTIEQPNALRKFWWHMCKRIARDANIQYYCGALTETLRLCIDAFVALHPDRIWEGVERRLLASNVASDADVLRLQKRIEEIEEFDITLTEDQWLTRG
jgi:hypothetical protein